MPSSARLTSREPIIAGNRSAPHSNRGATKLLPKSLPSLGQQLLPRWRDRQHLNVDRVRQTLVKAAVTPCERPVREADMDVQPPDAANGVPWLIAARVDMAGKDVAAVARGEPPSKRIASARPFVLRVGGYFRMPSRLASATRDPA